MSAARALFWRDLPLVSFAFYAATIGYAELANHEVPRYGFAWTFVFPWSVVLAIWLLRWRKDPKSERVWGVATCLAPPLVVLGTWLLGVRSPMDAVTLRNIYEASAIAHAGAVMLHAYQRSPQLCWLFLGPVAVYGACLENSGIALGYFSELNYHLYVAECG